MKPWKTINFDPRFYDLIRAGAKTQTRRLRKGEAVCRYGEPGHILRVTGTDMRIRVTSVRTETLSDITELDARAEGLDGRPAFFDAWREFHSRSQLRERVWVIGFVLADLAKEGEK